MLCHHENAPQNAHERCDDCANVDAFGRIVRESDGLLLIPLVPGGTGGVFQRRAGLLPQDHSIGNGEVDSSILSGSTIHFLAKPL